jgi:transcriptional regulator
MITIWRVSVKYSQHPYQKINEKIHFTQRTQRECSKVAKQRSSYFAAFANFSLRSLREPLTPIPRTMFVPKYAQNNDAVEIKEFIKHNGFGILISQSSQKLMATHIPLQFSQDESKLLGHMSKANPQWKNFEADAQVLAIFSGPHAYISSSWYDHENVPTWNYIAAHVYGNIRIIEGDELYEALKHLVDKYEASSTHPVSVETMSAEYVRKSMQGVVGFEITVTAIEAAYKLSQNRDQKNHQQVIHELEKRNEPGSLQIANEMKKRKF